MAEQKHLVVQAQNEQVDESRISQDIEKVSPVPPEESATGQGDLKESKDVAPVSFTSLFRFSTKKEIVLDVIGLIAAAAAGAAQPLMTLLFGNLTQDFVKFQTTLDLSKAGNETATASIPMAAAQFKHTAALDASYLTYIGVGMFVCTFISMYVWVYTGEANARRIRERYLQAILRQDIAFFDDVGAGEVATRIQTDTHLVQQGISDKVALSVNFTSAFVTGFILAYIRSWRLALALSSILPCITIAGAVINKMVSRFMQASLKHVADSGTLAEEVFSTIRTAQAFGTQQVLAGLFDGHTHKAYAAGMKSAAWSGGGTAVFFFIIYSAYGLAFSFGATLINQGHADAGSVINVFLSILIGSFSLALLAPESQAIVQACAAAAKLFSTIDRVPDIDSASKEGIKPQNCIGEVMFDHINFHYPSRPDVPVLKDLSITFPAGKTVALVGASGSGKSTVISLLERFYDPISGAVKLDGIDVKTLNVKWLRSQIGLVSQEPVLFSTTIKDNVAHGLIGTKYETASDDEKFALIREACIVANADGFISKLPLGYETLVGERGFLLSGGQKQRVAIARAIVSDPRILLLDEATSALDTQSEGIVQNALDKAAAGRTTITIAHRLSTVKDADSIYVMGDGAVLESGTHEQLIQANGPYARLVTAQKLRESATGQDHDNVKTLAVKEESEVEVESWIKEEVPQSGGSVHSRPLTQDPSEGTKNDHTLFYLFYRMGKISKEAWRKYLLGSIGAILAGMVHPAFGIVYAKGINAFGALDNHTRRIQGDRNALWFFIIAIGSSIAIGFQYFYFMSSAADLTSKLRSLCFRAILRQDIEYFDKEENSTGKLTSSVSDNPQKISDLAGVTLGTIVQALATLIGGYIIGLIFCWQLGLIGIACTPFLIFAGYIRLRVVVLKDKENKKSYEVSAKLACEAAASIRTVASLTREMDCCDLYHKSLDGPSKNTIRTAVWGNIVFALSQSMSFWVISLVFWFGSRLVAERKISTFQFFIGLMSTTFAAMQAAGVFSYIPDVSMAQTSASDVVTLLDSQPRIDAESTEGKVPQNIQGRIRFEGVHFGYPTRSGAHVLRDFSITVEPGTYVALVGASGCGKSTSIQLLERFYDPTGGEIYLDDENIAKFNVSEYRRHFALVSQEPTLYSGSIRFNVLLGATKPHSEVTQEEIEEACRNANILEFIESLPNGFDTEVGGKGSQLSGGQKQRIAIARALLRNPKILLLDEATSALDSNSEQVVQEALDRAAKGRTTIAIAHRLSTIQNADCIYFIRDGTISESGTHDQLFSLKGGYYEYVQLQDLGKT